MIPASAIVETSFPRARATATDTASHISAKRAPSHFASRRNDPNPLRMTQIVRGPCFSSKGAVVGEVV
jgi:hypothetical protein